MNAPSVVLPKLRLSLTARLTLLFAMGAAVVLLGLGWLISQSIERHFEDLDREALQAKLMLAHHAIARVTSTTELARLPSLLSDAATGHHAQTRCWSGWRKPFGGCRTFRPTLPTSCAHR